MDCRGRSHRSGSHVTGMVPQLHRPVARIASRRLQEGAGTVDRHIACEGRSVLLPRPSSDVIYRPVSGGAVLLSMTDEVYYGLNAVGASIWEALPPVLTQLDELCTRLACLYPDTDPDTIRADVQTLLRELAGHGLVAWPDVSQQDAAIEPRRAAQAAHADRA
jgi:hypothetical protein